MDKISYKQPNHVGYCVYYLINKNEIVYIGCTFNLSKRLGEHSSWLPFNLFSSRNYKGDKKGERGLFKKQFTHYSYIPFNNQKKAQLLESAEIKKHKPKYNNHSDYIWVSIGKKYTMYKLFRGLDNRRLNQPTPIVFYLMAWKKRMFKRTKAKHFPRRNSKYTKASLNYLMKSREPIRM
jgi:excinuclease UvrABC nuclease subunit